MDKYTLYLGDCLEYMRGMEAGSVDVIITDLPYGTTACNWDEIIPFAPMWECVKQILKSRGVFVTTTSQPFTSKLIMSNLDWFKYEWIWNKFMVSNPNNVKFEPLKSHENIIVFSKNGNNYYPIKDSQASKPFGKLSKSNSIITGGGGIDYLTGVGYPKSILNIPRPNNLSDGGFHPTQKPIELYLYLIQTYTNPDELVFDMCMGSGTTGVACMQLGRRFIGCEIDPGYFAIAERRIKAAAAQMLLPFGEDK